MNENDIIIIETAYAIFDANSEIEIDHCRDCCECDELMLRNDDDRTLCFYCARDRRIIEFK